VVVGTIAFFSASNSYTLVSEYFTRGTLVLVDFPSTATFLTPEERAYIIFRKSEQLTRSILSGLKFHPEYDNSTVGEEAHFSPKHVLAALSDWQVWLHILVYMSIVGPRMFPI
jgi:hypothetical protein